MFLLFVQFAVLQLVVLLGAEAWREMWDTETVPATLFFSGAVLAPLTALYVGLLRHAPHERTATALRLGTPAGWQWGMVGCALVAGTALAPLAADTIARMVEAFPLDPNEAVDEPSPLVLYSLLVLGYPVVVELFFRGFMQARLQRTVGVWRACLIATLFDVVTQRLIAMPAEVLIAGAMGVLMAWSGSAWVPIAGHVAYHGVPVLLVSLGIDFPGLLTTQRHLPPWQDAVYGGVAVAALVTAWALSRGRAR